MEKEGRYYNLTPLLEEMTSELKAEIEAGVHAIVDNYSKDSCSEDAYVPKLLKDCAQEAVIHALEVIQERGQIFVTTPRWKELGDTPWYDDLTDKLFDEVNT